MPEFIVIGAGAAGLVAANALHEAGREVVVLERQDVPGGRLRTDRADGFQFDRGFHILLPRYPAAARWLDTAALGLGHFDPGAHVLLPDGSATDVTDPLRQPATLLATLRSPVGTLLDKARLLILVAHVRGSSSEALFAEPETSTLAYLRDRGFSATFIDHFLRPFYGGIFLERALGTSSRFFLFTFKMFAEGPAALPRRGIQAIGEQLAARLPGGSVRYGVEVARVSPTGVELADGERLDARRVLDARTPPAGAPGDSTWLPTVNVYFATPSTTLPPRLVTLLPPGGPVTNVVVVSGAQPAYAPAGQELISVSLDAATGRDLDAYATVARDTLRPWLGAEVDAWRALRHYEIPRALPFAPHTTWSAEPHAWRGSQGELRFGDWRLHPSLQAALHSGELAARHCLRVA